MGASCDELGLDFTVGEGPRADSGFLAFVGAVLATDEDRAEEADGVGVLRVGVADLETDLDVAGTEGLVAGVEERELVLPGAAAAAVVLAEGNDAREVGVEGLDIFEMEDTRGRPVGVADLEAVDFLPPDDAGLPFPLEEEFMLLEEVLFPEDVVVDAPKDELFCEARSFGESAGCNIP